MDTKPPSRTDTVRLQGQLESAGAVLTAALLASGTASPGMAALVGAMAVWMAVRGRARVLQAVPLSEAERRELERLATQSRQVRELIGALDRLGQQPVRYDLLRCRQLARIESMLDGRT